MDICDKIKQTVSKEAFAEASKVVDKSKDITLSLSYEVMVKQHLKHFLLPLNIAVHHMVKP